MTYPRHGLLLLLALAVPGLVSAQGIGAAPTTAQCTAWATALGEGGEAAMDALRFGAISRCPDQAPAALERAILGARTVTDTSFLSGLAGQASAVRDPAVFDASLRVAEDVRAAAPARAMSLLIVVAQLGGGQDMADWTRGELLSQVVPADQLCGFGVAGFAPHVDNGLPADAERLAAGVMDEILYGNGQPALVRNLARCARTAIDPSIPPQVDTSRIRLDHRCGNRYRVQNHTGADLPFSYIFSAPSGEVIEEAGLVAPAQGAWTTFTAAADAGTLTLSYDGHALYSVSATGRGCGGER